MTPAWSPPTLRLGEEVEAYTGTNTMRVDVPGSKVDMLVVSTDPLVAKTDAGTYAPTDTSLVPSGNGWRAANVSADTAVGGTIGEGLSLGEGDQRLVVRAGRRSSAAGRLSGKKVFYGNSDVDADTIVEATPRGASVAWTVRSPAAPESYPLAFELPTGVTLQLVGSRLVLLRGGVVVGEVSAPFASDAQGTPVPAEYALIGNGQVEVRLAHRKRDVAYPVAIDPLVNYGGGVFGLLDPGPSTGPPLTAGWTIDPSGSGWSWSPAALQLSGNSTATGHVRSQAPAYRASYLTRAEFRNVTHQSASSKLRAGLFHTSTGWGETGYGEYQESGATPPFPNAPAAFENTGGIADPVFVVTCASASCAPGVGTEGNRAAFELSRASGTGNIGATFAGGYLFLRDRNLPTATSDLPVGWRTSTSSINANATFADAGLGLREYAIVKANFSGASLLDGAMFDCEGVTGDRCPDDDTVPFATGALIEGANHFELIGTDVIEQDGEAVYSVGVDTQAPTETKLSDALWARKSRTLSRKTPLRIRVKDAESHPGDPGSGIEHVVVKEKPGPLSGSGTWVDKYDSGECPAVPFHCGNADKAWVFDPATHTAGSTYSIRVEAQDQVGHPAPVQEFEVTVATGKITTLDEGTKTARRVKLEALANTTGQTNVRFKWRKPSQVCKAIDECWQDIPLGHLTQGRDQSVASWPLTLNGEKKSPMLTWDVAATTAASGVFVDGDVQVRAEFSGGIAGTSEEMTVALDRSGVKTNDSTEAIGPGSVDLLTGNFALGATDVSIESPIADLVVARTYNSRISTDGPLGPGWELSFPVPQANSQFVRLRDHTSAADTDGYLLESVTAVRADGSELVFEGFTGENNTTIYEPADGNTDLELKRVGVEFLLSDHDGNVTTFRANGTSTTEFLPSRVQQAGSETVVGYGRDPGNASRVTWVFGPHPTGKKCSIEFVSELDPECRALHLSYDGNGKLSTVALSTAVKSGSSYTRSEEVVAQYAYDGGKLVEAWDPRISPTLKTTYAYNGAGLLETVTPPGEQPWTIDYIAAVSSGSGDTDAKGRLRKVSRPTLDSSGDPDDPAETTVVYDVPRTGGSAPYAMGEATTATWGQDDLPAAATAIFPPDQVPGSPPSSYSKASVFYLDAFGYTVNEAEPGGRIATTEHDRFGNVVRALTARNRERALEESNSVTESRQLDTQRIYSADGKELRDELGPRHWVKRLSDGQTLYGRRHTTHTYDESKPTLPADTEYHLVTTTTVGLKVGTDADVDVRTTKTSYDLLSTADLPTGCTDINDCALAPSGWGLRKPTSVTVDPGASPKLNLTTKTRYNVRGQTTQESRPKDPDANTAGTTLSTYWAGGEAGTCTGQAQWAGMLCRTTPASSSPALPTSQYRYDKLGQVVRKVDTVAGGPSRTETIAYDAAGRKLREETDGVDLGDGVLGWWKADAITGLRDGQAVSAWPDSSGNGRTLSQATAAKRPTYRLAGAEQPLQFPDTAVIDDADRANASSLGAGWESQNWVGEPRIVDNEIAAASDGSHSWAFREQATAPDSEVFATLATKPSWAIAELWLRADWQNGDGYVINAYEDEVIVSASDGYDNTHLETFNRTISAGDALGARMIGDRLTVYYRPAGGDWSELGGVTDDTYKSSGQIGFHVDTTVTRLDDFGGGTVTDFPATPTVDDANRADASTPGSGWEQPSWASPLSITSNTFGDGGAETFGLRTTKTRADSEVFAKVVEKPTWHGVQLYLRSDWNRGNAYYVEAYGNQVFIGRYRDFSYTVLETIDRPVDAGDSLGLRAVGETLTAYFKPSGGSWRAIGQAEDDVLSEGGKIGFSIGDMTRFDDFGGGTISGSPSAPPVVDDFNRANRTLDSGDWTALSYSPALSIISNEIGSASGGGDSFWKERLGPDTEVRTTVRTPGVFWMYARLRDFESSWSTVDGYSMSYDGSVFWIWKYVNGTQTALGTHSGHVDLSTDDVISFSAIGDTLTVRRNGEKVIERTDGSVAGAGAVAVGVENNTPRLDSFSARTVIPEHARLDGRPVVRHDGHNDLLQMASGVTTAKTVFVVASWRGEHRSDRPLLGDSTASDFHGASNDSPALGVGRLWHSSGANAKINAGETRVNGGSSDFGSYKPGGDLQLIEVQTNGTQTLQFNRTTGDRTYGDRVWSGDYAEVIAYDRVLSSGEREKIEDYLTRKYDLVVADPPPSATDAGEGRPATGYRYDEETGRLIETSAAGKTITRQYDALGRLTAYTDADGVTSETTYDALNRPHTFDDGKGVQEFFYDGDSDPRGLLWKIDDSQLGEITGEYDADGRLFIQELPGGLTLGQQFDPVGNVTDRCYTRGVWWCDSNTWLHMIATYSVHDQVATEETFGVGARKYFYDAASRLTETRDIPQGEGCTMRLYTFDANSNRESSTTRSPAGGGACASSGGTTASHSYDAADRLTDSGTVYDGLGRTLTTVAANAGGHKLTATYHVDDLVRSLTQNAVRTTLSLDAAGRPRVRQKTGATDEIHHYSDDSDSPSYIQKGAGHERSVTGLDGDLIGNHTNTDGAKLFLTDMHGDTIAETDTSTTSTAPTAKRDQDEFGVPDGSPDAKRFEWLGAKQRQTQTATGVITMGARVYNPQLGRFLQVDPVRGGSANDYDYANQDPVNQFDLDGRESKFGVPQFCVGGLFGTNCRPSPGRTVVEKAGSASHKAVHNRYTRSCATGGGTGAGLGAWSGHGAAVSGAGGCVSSVVVDEINRRFSKKAGRAATGASLINDFLALRKGSLNRLGYPGFWSVIKPKAKKRR